jgi:multimeric flavodoxin WrbA
LDCTTSHVNAALNLSSLSHASIAAGIMYRARPASKPPRIRKGVAFTSSGGLWGGNEITLMSILSVILNFGMITFGVPDYVSENVTLHYGAVSIKKPDEDGLKACKLLGRRLAEHTNVIKKRINP